jgi:DNA-binding GntR family transcriptional regulator
MVELLGRSDEQFDPVLNELAATLRTAIVLGEFAPHTRLDEQWLAEKFSVTRVQIREIFPILEFNGLIYRQGHRGIYVSGLSEEDIHEIYEYRMMIELYALRKLLHVQPRPDFSPLQELLQQTLPFSPTSSSDMKNFVDIDLAFHRQIVILANNRRILRAWDRKVELIRAFLSVIHETLFDRVIHEEPHPFAKHHHMLKLIIQGDEQKVIAEFAEHLEHSEELTQQAIITARQGHTKHVS